MCRRTKSTSGLLASSKGELSSYNRTNECADGEAAFLGYGDKGEKVADGVRAALMNAPHES
jgi:hypothetical protein